MPNIDQIKEQLITKNKELEELRQQILSVKEEEKGSIVDRKIALEGEIKQLEIQKIQSEKNIDEKAAKELYNQEKGIANLQSTNEVKNLKENLEKLPNTYELINGTTMYKSLLTYFNNDEKKVEEFSNKIEKPVKTYLTQELPGINERIIESLSIAIQFSMMEQLQKEGQDKMADLFSGFGNMNTKESDGSVSKGNISSVFKGMFGFFGQSGKFFTLAKRVDNLVTILRLHKDELQTGTGKITNPLECKTLLNNAMWDNIKEEEGQTLEQLGITTNVQTDPEWKEKIRAIANSDKLKMTDKMIQSLEKATDKAQSFLEKRVAYKEKMLDLVRSGDGWMDIGIPGVFTLGELLGGKKGGGFIDLFDKNKGIGKILNFIFKILGFGGIDGFKKEVIQEKINSNMPESGKEFITNVLSTYNEESQKPENQIVKPEDELLQTIGLKKNEKLSISYTLLKKQIEENIKTNPEKIISPEVAKEFGFPVEETEVNGKKIVKITFLQGFDAANFTEQYLKTKVKDITENEDCMKQIDKSERPKEDFLLAITGGITSGSMFISGVALGVQTAYMYYKKPQETGQVVPETKEEVLPSGNLLYADRVKGTPEEQKQFLEKVKQVAKNLGTNINPNWLMFVMNGESGFNPQAVNKGTKEHPGTNATGLIQFMPKTAEALGTTVDELYKMTAIQQLDYVEKFYLGWKDKLPQVKTYQDLALLTFYPAAVGKTGEFNIGGSDVATDNPGFDVDKNKQITKSEYAEALKKKVEGDIPTEYKDQFFA